MIRPWVQLTGEETEWLHPVDAPGPHCRVRLTRYAATTGPGAPDFVWYGSCAHHHVYRADVLPPDPARPYRRSAAYTGLRNMAEAAWRFAHRFAHDKGGTDGTRT